MQCPIDGAELAIAERAGVEIDYCPKCRGVWLDRGELDKIIDRSAAEAGPAGGDPRAGGHTGQPGSAPRKKRESFLSELFDF
jgi:Zn-finger nucleic acid-binding protein